VIADWLGVLRWRWCRPVGDVVARRASQDASGHAEPADIRALEACMWRIQRSARWVPRSRCLDRALRLLDVADAMAIPAQLRIGVLRVGINVRAHAWVVCGDAILDPDPVATRRYLPLQGAGAGMEFD